MTTKPKADEPKDDETTKGTEGENDPRPTGTNSRQDAEIAELKGQVAALMAALNKGGTATVADAKAGNVIGNVPAEETRKAVKAASTEPTTYVALEDGTDLKQGFIKAGTPFTTTQPPSAWMQPVDSDPSEDE